MITLKAPKGWRVVKHGKIQIGDKFSYQLLSKDWIWCQVEFNVGRMVDTFYAKIIRKIKPTKKGK